MGELLNSWQARLDAHPDKAAIVLAETGAVTTFRQLDAWADAFLEKHPELQEGRGRALAFAAASPKEWIGIYLVALKSGMVAMPTESVGAGGFNESQLQASGVSFAVADGQLTRQPDGGIFEGGHLIKFTSGTTGTPVALLFTEAEMAADGRQIMQTMGVEASDRNYAMIPLGHSYGLGNLIMPLILAGTEIVMGSAPYPQVVADEIHRYQCTVFPSVPPVLKALAHSDVAAESPGSLKRVISAGSPLPPEVAREFLDRYGRRIHNFYGSSETGGICFDRTGDATLSGAGIGTPLDGVTVEVDPEGAIFVRSPAVCRSALETRGCRMNDFGRWNSDGVLQLIGRNADFVKVAGKRLFLTEVEQVLAGIDGVVDAYVTQRPSRRGEVQIVALIQGTIPPAELKAQLQREMPGWKIPKRIHVVGTIPYTPRGKKDRKALEALVDEQ